MRQLLYLGSAQDDLVDILRYITRESASLAIGSAFIDKLTDRCERLAALPGTLGSARPELRHDIRSVSHQGYVIFFRYGDGRVEIVNILSAQRDVDAYFHDRGPVI
jgi:plasmid stabilization system protein ParE